MVRKPTGLQNGGLRASRAKLFVERKGMTKVGAEMVRFSTCCRTVTSLSVWQRRPWCWYLIVTQLAAISHHYDPANQVESLLSNSTNDWRALSTVLSACVGGSINDHHAGLHMLCTRCQVRPGCKHSILFPYTILRTPISGLQV